MSLSEKAFDTIIATGELGRSSAPQAQRPDVLFGVQPLNRTTSRDYESLDAAIEALARAAKRTPQSPR